MFIKSLVETVISVLASLYLFSYSIYSWINKNTDREDWVIFISFLILGNLSMFLVGCIMCILKP